MRWVVSSSDWSEENLGFRHCSREGRESALLLSLSTDAAPGRDTRTPGVFTEHSERSPKCCSGKLQNDVHFGKTDSESTGGRPWGCRGSSLWGVVLRSRDGIDLRRGFSTCDPSNMRKQQQQEAEMRKRDHLVFWLFNVCVEGESTPGVPGRADGPAKAWERGQKVTGFWLKHLPAAQLSPETREVRTWSGRWAQGRAAARTSRGDGVDWAWQLLLRDSLTQICIVVPEPFFKDGVQSQPRQRQPVTPRQLAQPWGAPEQRRGWVQASADVRDAGAAHLPWPSETVQPAGFGDFSFLVCFPIRLWASP